MMVLRILRARSSLFLMRRKGWHSMMGARSRPSVQPGTPPATQNRSASFATEGTTLSNNVGTTKSCLVIRKAKYEGFFPEEQPGLIILVDLGAKAYVIKTIETPRENIFGFTVDGSSSDDYKYLSPDISQVFKLLHDTTQPFSNGFQREVRPQHFSTISTPGQSLPGFANASRGGTGTSLEKGTIMGEDNSSKGPRPLQHPPLCNAEQQLKHRVMSGERHL